MSIRIVSKSKDGERRTTPAKDGKDAALIIKNALNRQWYDAMKAKEQAA